MFRPEVATAMASFFLDRAPNRTLNDLVLMKLLVISEREFLKETSSLLTGDHFASMQNGPVLSETLNMLKGKSQNALCKEFIQFIPWKEQGASENRCALKSHLEVDEYLTEYEQDVLEKVWNQYGDKTKWDLVDLTHTFPEWDKSCAETKSSRPIPLEKILNLSFGVDPDVAKATEDDILSYESLSVA